MSRYLKEHQIEVVYSYSRDKKFHKNFYLYLVLEVSLREKMKIILTKASLLIFLEKKNNIFAFLQSIYVAPENASGNLVAHEHHNYWLHKYYLQVRWVFLFLTNNNQVYE